MAFFTERYHTPGTPSGTQVDARTPETPPLQIRLVDYSPDAVTVLDAIDATDFAPLL